jgi:sulfatase maturation enzyme AslB (radical SAM superfamily)
MRKKDVIVICLTNYCELSCKYCYYPTCAESVLDSEWTKEYFRDFVFKSLDYHIDFTGLTSYTYSMWCALITHFTSIKEIRDLKISLQTNGVYLNHDIVNCIIKHNISVGISYDGLVHCNDKVRMYKNGLGSGKSVEKKINLLGNYNIPHIVRCTVAGHNYRYGQEIYYNLKNIKCQNVHFNYLLMKNNAVKNAFELKISVTDFIAFLQRYNDTAIKNKDWSLLDNMLKKWFFRIIGNDDGWVHYCPTSLCNIHNNIDVVWPDKKTYKCTRFIEGEVVCTKEIDRYRFLHCTKCIAYCYCNGGCNLGLLYDKSGLSDQCQIIKWYFNYINEHHHILSNMYNSRHNKLFIY